MSDRTFVRLDDIQPEALSWLWSNWIPLGGITMCDGDPGEGKSAVFYDLIARVTAGRPMPFTSEFAEPAGVVLLQAEDFLAATVRPTLEALGADLSRIVVFDKHRFLDKPFRLPDDVDIIREAIERVKAKLVVFDPLPAFLNGNPNSDQSMRKALGPLAAMAEERHVAIVGVRHVIKGREPSMKHRGAGSMSIIAAARSAMLVGPDPDSDDPYRHVLMLSKSNLGDAKPIVYRTVKANGIIAIEWVEERHRTPETSRDHFDHSQLDEACYVLYSILSFQEEPMPARDAQQEAAKALVASRTLKRAKQKLGVVSHRIESNDGKSWQWVWKLPEDHGQFKRYKDRAVREHAERLTKLDGERADSTGIELAVVTMDRPWDDAASDEGIVEDLERLDDNEDALEPVSAGGDLVRPGDE